MSPGKAAASLGAGQNSAHVGVPGSEGGLDDEGGGLVAALNYHQGQRVQSKEGAGHLAVDGEGDLQVSELATQLSKPCICRMKE